MSFKINLLALFALVCAANAAICPPESVMGPCFCNEEEITIGCHDIRNFDIKSTFDEMSSFVDEDVIFEQLLMSGLTLTEIPAGAVQSIKFRSISIAANPNLRYISPYAFNASSETVTRMNIWANNLNEDIFDLVKQFPNVETIDFGNNANLTSIPDEGFANLQALRSVSIGSGVVSSIGSRVFANSTNLELVWLRRNNITEDRIASDAFEGVGSQVDLDLHFNPIKTVPEDKFKNLLDTSAKLRVGTPDCYGPFCSWEALECDERADWLCSKSEVYSKKLFGFICTPMPVWEEVFNYYC